MANIYISTNKHVERSAEIWRAPSARKTKPYNQAKPIPAQTNSQPDRTHLYPYSNDSVNELSVYRFMAYAQTSLNHTIATLIQPKPTKPNKKKNMHFRKTLLHQQHERTRPVHWFTAKTHLSITHRAEQNVGGLQVPVQDRGRVYVFHPAQYLVQEVLHVLVAQPLQHEGEGRGGGSKEGNSSEED